MACNKCTTDKCPNYGEMKVLKDRVHDIQAGYRKDKKFWRMVFKWMAIAIALLIAELITVLTKGKDIIALVVEAIIKKVF